MARQKMDIDESVVAQMAFDGASNREIGDILGIDHKTVANRFSPLLNKKRAERRVGLRKAQTAAALAGDKTMLVWLGKQELGQTDKLKYDLSNLTDEQVVALYRSGRNPRGNGTPGPRPVVVGAGR